MMMTPLTFALGWALATAGSEPLPLGGDYGEPRLLVSAPDDPAIRHLSWPKIVATNDGTLVLAYSAGRGHNIGGSGPAVSRSTDAGDTFSPPKLLAYFPEDDERYRDCGNVALGVAEDGAVLLLAMAYSGRRNTILGWRSTDDGKTWAPVDTSAIGDNQTGSVFGHVLRVPGMGLVVFGHYRPPARETGRGIWMSVSGDGGKSWGPPRVVAEGSNNEPAVTFTQGRFVGLFRLTAGAGIRRYDEAVSDDLGETWRIRPSALALPEGLPGRQPSPFIAASPTEPSRLYAIQSIRGDFQQTRGRAYLWTADAKELQWRREGRLAAIPASAGDLSDWSYPWMAPLVEGKWMLVFYAGLSRGASSIYGMVIDPQEPGVRP